MMMITLTADTAKTFRGLFLATFLITVVSSGFIIFPEQVSAKITPNIAVSCATNPITVHSATNCTANVTAGDDNNDDDNRDNSKDNDNHSDNNHSDKGRSDNNNSGKNHSLAGFSITFSSSGTGVFTPAATCSLSGNENAASCSAAYTPSAVNGGAHTITGNFAGDNHYGPASGSAYLIVNKIALTISANAASKSYGDPDPLLTYKISSGSLALEDTISGSLIRAAGEKVGTYAITQGTLSAGENYNLTFIPAVLTVEIGNASSSAVLTTTANADNSLSAIIPTEAKTSATSGGIAVSFDIPAGTVISGPTSWDGSLALPAATTVFTAPTPDSGSTISVASAISVGAGDTRLTLDKAVRLVFAGQANYFVGWSQGGVFTRITTACSTDSQAAGDALTNGADCKINSGADLTIWTKHFTSYITYTQKAVSVSSSGDGGSCAICYARDDAAAAQATQAAMLTPEPLSPAASASAEPTPELPDITPAPIPPPAGAPVSINTQTMTKHIVKKLTAKKIAFNPSLQAAIVQTVQTNNSIPQSFIQKIFDWLLKWLKL